MEPWGTPYETEISEKRQQSVHTNSVLLVKYDLNHSFTLPLNPEYSNSLHRM